MEGGFLGLAARGGLAAALCALAGCGGTSIADYRERAGAICHQATGPLNVRVQGQDFGDLARLAPEARRRYADALARLADLEPPETRRPEHEALVTAGRRLRASYDRLAASGGGLIDRVEGLARLEPPRHAAAVHDRMVRALSAYAQALVTRRGRGDARPTLRAIGEAREALKARPEPGQPA